MAVVVPLAEVPSPHTKFVLGAALAVTVTIAVDVLLLSAFTSNVHVGEAGVVVVTTVVVPGTVVVELGVVITVVVPGVTIVVVPGTVVVELGVVTVVAPVITVVVGGVVTATVHDN